MVRAEAARSLRCSVFIATSLDGFIAREDGAIDWLPGAGGAGEAAEARADPPEAGADAATPESPGEDHGFSAFFASVDALVMGRHTYETVLGFGAWPYREKPVIVLTTRPLEAPPANANVEAMRGTPEEVVARLEARGLRHLYVDGGETIRRFLAAGLIDRLIVTRVPVLIGRGRPLFGAVPADVALRHVATRSWENGLVQSEYEVLHPA